MKIDRIGRAARSHTFELPTNDRLRIKGEFDSIDDRFHMAEELLTNPRIRL